MNGWKSYLLPAVPIAIVAILLGFHPIMLVGLGIGALFPNVDTVDVRVHRSWFFHTFFPPTVLYLLVTTAGYESTHIFAFIHFITIGMGIHFILDYIYPKSQHHPGAEWPVRPTIWSAPWGILWLGIAWTIQWFFYLSSAFLPWLVGANV